DYSLKEKRDWSTVRFLFAGRLEEIKGLKYLLDSFKKISNTYNNCELWIAGDGTMREYVKNFINENRLGNKIVFLGWRTDIPALLHKTDVFVLPSWEHGQPVALLEAFASGKIILTSLDFITDGKDGIKVKPNDTDDLYQKMVNITKNFKKYSNLSQGAKTTAKFFAWERVVKQFVKEYKRAL
ncbi:MAG: glycosyltransferase family 4 protein, partial [Nanoarchaeota archaeon]